MGFGQRAVEQQFVVDLHFVTDAQAIRHFDDVDPVDKRFVVLVVAEGVPLRFVGVSQQDASKRDRAQAFGAVVVAFLGGRQQWVQPLIGALNISTNSIKPWLDRHKAPE